MSSERSTTTPEVFKIWNAATS